MALVAQPSVDALQYNRKQLAVILCVATGEKTAMKRKTWIYASAKHSRTSPVTVGVG